MGSDKDKNEDVQSDKFDKVLQKIGLGRWTALMVAVSISWGMVLPYFSMGSAFYNPKVDYTCTIPQLSNSSWTEEQKQSVSIPWEKGQDKLIRSKCFKYARNYSQLSQMDWMPDLIPTLEEDVQLISCTSWNYNQSTFDHTVTMEWNLVCDNAWWSPLFQSLYFFGSAVGEPILGYLADRFGRRWVLRGSSIIFIFFAMGSSLVPVYSLILVSRFVLGMLHTAGAGVAYVYAMEVCPPKHRTLFGLFLNGPFAITGIAFGGLAYFFRSWRTLQLVCSLPAFLSLSLLPFIDESPRWQLLKGKTEDGVRTLKKAAKWHGVDLTQEELMSVASVKAVPQPCQEEKNKVKNFANCRREDPTFVSLQNKIFKWIKELFTLVRTPVIRRITLCMFGCWFVVGVIYWGMSLSGTTFSSDPFLYMALSSLMELPGYFAFVPVVSRFGRKKVLSINFAISAVSILAILLTPKENTWVIFALALIGKLFITSSYNILYLFSSELFPTCIRSRGLNISSMMCRIGSIITPFINEILVTSEAATWTPSVIFGCLAVFGCIMALFLPESKDKPLSETVEEVERLHGKNSTNSSSQSLDKKAALTGVDEAV